MVYCPDNPPGTGDSNPLGSTHCRAMPTSPHPAGLLLAQQRQPLQARAAKGLDIAFLHRENEAAIAAEGCGHQAHGPAIAADSRIDNLPVALEHICGILQSHATMANCSQHHLPVLAEGFRGIVQGEAVDGHRREDTLAIRLELLAAPPP